MIDREVLSPECTSVYLLLATVSPAVIITLLVYSLGPDFYLPVAAVTASFFFGVHTGWIISPVAGLSAGLDPFWLFLLLVLLSVESSLIVSANYDLLEKAPLLGRLMERVRSKAVSVIEKNEFVAKMEFVSIFCLMFIPVYGTGPLSMSLVGRLLGLDWIKVWLTISLSASARFALIIFLLGLI